jgi:S-adenosylmethionine hydrolase
MAKQDMCGLVTLTSDFGLQDYYVSAMKGVMLQIATDLQLIDVSHEIPPQDVMAGAWVTMNSALLYPQGTVHLVVVDPGVGTRRRPVAVRIEDQYFVGPDNGLFALVAGDRSYEAVELSNESYRRDSVSNTFHGRDIFAPAAAHLANGVDMNRLGKPVEELETYRWAQPVADKDGLQGWVIHIDRFGNLVTNLSADLINETVGEQDVKIYAGNMILNDIVDTFGDVEEGEPAAYIGSAGMLEVGVNKGDAETLLGIQKGSTISIVLQ